MSCSIRSGTYCECRISTSSLGVCEDLLALDESLKDGYSTHGRQVILTVDQLNSIPGAARASLKELDPRLSSHLNLCFIHGGSGE